MTRTESAPHEQSAPECPANPGALSRRDLLALASKIALGSLAVCGGALGVRMAWPSSTVRSDSRRCLGPASDFRMATMTFLPEHELFVVHQESGFAAISSRCTHLGCTVRRTSDGFACPCHGARYGEQGEVQSGPAPRALDWLALSLDDEGRLWVDASRRVERGTFAVPSERGQRA